MTLIIEQEIAKQTIFRDLENGECFISMLNKAIYRKITMDTAYNITSNRYCNGFNLDAPVIPAEFKLVRVK